MPIIAASKRTINAIVDEFLVPKKEFESLFGHHLLDMRCEILDMRCFGLNSQI